MLIVGQGQVMDKINLKHICIPDGKETIQYYQGHDKGHECHLEKTSTGQKWSISFNKDNNRNGLKHIICI